MASITTVRIYCGKPVLHDPTKTLLEHGLMCDGHKGLKPCPSPSLVVDKMEQVDSMGRHVGWTGSGLTYVACAHRCYEQPMWKASERTAKVDAIMAFHPKQPPTI